MRYEYGDKVLDYLSMFFYVVGSVILAFVRPLSRIFKFKIKTFPDSFRRRRCLYLLCSDIHDTFDFWTWGHTLATLILSSLTYSFIHSPLIASFVGFWIMFLYEIVIDGYGREDYAFSITDIVANLLGSLLFIFIWRIV